jgi:hypothetical protein
VAHGPGQRPGRLGSGRRVGLVGSHRVRPIDPQGAAPGLEPGPAPVPWRLVCPVYRGSSLRIGARQLCPFRLGGALCSLCFVLEARPGGMGNRLPLPPHRYLRLLALHASFASPAVAGSSQYELCSVGPGHGSCVAGGDRRGQLGCPLVRSRHLCCRGGRCITQSSRSPLEGGAPSNTDTRTSGASSFLCRGTTAVRSDKSGRRRKSGCYRTRETSHARGRAFPRVR